MDHQQDYFLSYNKEIEERLDYLIHSIDHRIDQLYADKFNFPLAETHQNDEQSKGKIENSFSHSSFLQFKAPYIRDIRGFSGPSNAVVSQIREFTGTEDIDLLVKNKRWSKDSKQQLFDAVLDHHAQLHIIELIRQKNAIAAQANNLSEINSDIRQKLSLIDGQIEQVKARKEPRIFVPEDRNDPTVDWCAISAKLKNSHLDAKDCRLMWSNSMHWSINNSLWTKEEDTCLLSAIQKYGKNNWDAVSKELNSNRLAWQCCSRYHQALSTNCSQAMPISDSDAEKILEVVNLCRIGNFVPWNQVMYFLQYYTLLQVRYQWIKHITNPGTNRQWTLEEDSLLLTAIQKFGIKDWNRISNEVPGRSNKSCRERYVMRLQYHSRILGRWLPKEDKYLRLMVEKFGSDWSVISRNFPGRNCHQIRSRYESLKKEVTKSGTLRHRKLIRLDDGNFTLARKKKPESELEVTQRLKEIFSIYSSVDSLDKKKIVCRSAQDEQIHQSLVKMLASILVGRDSHDSLLDIIISRAIRKKVTQQYELFTPNSSNLKGFKAWALEQDRGAQPIEKHIDIEQIMICPDYRNLLRIVMSIFLWPAVLSRVEAPDLDNCITLTGGIIEKEAKNFYKIRELQKQLASAAK